MFGSREEFPYLECDDCGCVQLAESPVDLSRYYGEGYYSTAPARARPKGIHASFKRLRTRAYLESSTGFIGRTLLKTFGPPQLLDWIRHAGIRQRDRILEVGCGSGQLLLAMQSEGFSCLTGVDPFIERDIDYGNNLKIHKRKLSDTGGEYDFVVLEHAFEHIPDPLKTMAKLKTLLAPGGTLIVSIPVVGHAWRRYGVDWIQLDAPRHLFLHTERSFRLLAGSVEDVVYDSTAMQFWGSEQYRRGIPLLDPRSYRNDPSAFTTEQIDEFKRVAESLNRAGQGDQATFYVRA